MVNELQMVLKRWSVGGKKYFQKKKQIRIQISRRKERMSTRNIYGVKEKHFFLQK